MQFWLRDDQRRRRKLGHFDEKTRERVALAVAVSLRCYGCITVHAEAARKAGATEEELPEALSVAISVNAGAALIYSLEAFHAGEDAAII
jgi:AhpD family alkylhydroperoxidase